jgi:hypothetical protein
MGSGAIRMEGGGGGNDNNEDDVDKDIAQQLYKHNILHYMPN